MLADQELQPGTLNILNASKGDLTITFNAEDTDEVKQKALDLVQDLLRRGYVIFAQDENGEPRRVTRFELKTRTYIVEGTRDEGIEEAIKAENTAAIAVAPLAGG